MKKHLRNIGRAHNRGTLAGLGAMPGNDPGMVPWGLGEAGGRFFGDDSIEGLEGVESSIWPSTSDIDTETQSLAITIANLGHDYAASGLSTSNDAVAMWERAWNSFVSDFLQWQKAAYFWNPTRRDDLIKYRANFNTILSQYRSLGGPTLSAAVAGAAPAADSLDKVMVAVKWGGLLLAAGMAYKITSDIGLWKKLGDI